MAVEETEAHSGSKSGQSSKKFVFFSDLLTALFPKHIYYEFITYLMKTREHAKDRAVLRPYARTQESHVRHKTSKAIFEKHIVKP